jgi:hypothetical protein
MSNFNPTNPMILSNSKRLRLILPVMSLAVFSSVHSHAQVLASWDTLGDFAVSPVADGTVAGTMASGVVMPTGLTRGPGVVMQSLVRSFSSVQWGDAANSFAAYATKEDAVAGGDYLFFTLAPAEGLSLSFEGLDVKIRRAASAPGNFGWQYQVGIGDFVDAGSEMSYTGTETNGAFLPQVTLSDIGDLQEVTEPVTFRLVAWGAGHETASLAVGRSSSSVNEDVLIVSGAVIPEPSTYAVIFGGMALAGVVFHRRLVRRRLRA